MSQPDDTTAMRLLVGSIRRAEVAERFRTDPQGVLAELPLAAREALRGVAPERLLVYRRLVHNRIRRVISEFLPRTHARLGRDRLARDVQAFLAADALTSPYWRDVPGQFVAWVATRWQEDPAISDYLVDLARHECLAFDVRNDPAGGEKDTGLPLALDRPLRFDGTTRLMRYAYAVHQLSADVEVLDEPEPFATSLLVYRDDEHTVRYLQLTPFAAEVVAALRDRRRPVSDGLREACAALDMPLNDERLAEAAALLADLADRKVLRGAEP